ncbi:hypothetical protein [Agrobacterium vitis]|uniref:Lipoprotein n=1 Tax=Agrobacterium vitis TaxID=373 RepID=A0AAE2R9L0_AGRVI|nr:hypothetical protein [Agrobacterium vitis]MBF2714338.1 hypothetical protein [Agrobacterium vitis]MVA22000.1 hypothetical protein [Agrobacterium vitis]
MKYIFAAGIPLFGLAGCVTIPSPQSERAFSYNNIVNQVECETFLAISDLEDSPKFEWAKLDQWAINISISPSSTLDSQIGFGGSHKSRKGDDYFQWLAGGTGASPGGINYEQYGNHLAKNEYQLRVSALFEPVRDAQGNPIVNASGNQTFVVKDGKKQANRDLVCIEKGKPLKEGVPHSAFAGGFFGIEQFLASALPNTGSLKVLPKTIGYSKEYKAKLQAGVTAGWYVPLGNSSPAIGGYGVIDNIIGVTFTPVAKDPLPKPVPVYMVDKPSSTTPVVRVPGSKSTRGKTGSPTPTPNGASERKTLSLPLPPDASDRLTNGSNFLLQQQYLRQLTPELSQ